MRLIALALLVFASSALAQSYPAQNADTKIQLIAGKWPRKQPEQFRVTARAGGLETTAQSREILVMTG